MTNPQPELCPSPERLAAFLDGRLAGTEREEVMRHLDSCEECYEVFTGVVEFQQEEMSAGEVVEHPAVASWARPVRRVAVAAAVALAVVGAWTLLRPAGPSVQEVTTADLLAPLAEAGDLQEAAAHPWREAPSTLAFAPSGSPAGPAFRLGVVLVDAAAALAAEDRAAAREALRRASAVAGSVDRGIGLAVALDGIREEVAVRGSLIEAGRQLGNAEALAARTVEPLHLALGKWAEAARLAALAENRGFFERPGFDAALGHLEEEAPEEVAAVREAAGAAEIDFEALVGELEELIRIGEEGRPR